MKLHMLRLCHILCMHTKFCEMSSIGGAVIDIFQKLLKLKCLSHLLKLVGSLNEVDTNRQSKFRTQYMSVPVSCATFFGCARNFVKIFPYWALQVTHISML